MSGEIAVIEIGSQNLLKSKEAKEFFSSLGMKVDWYSYGEGIKLNLKEEVEDLIPFYEGIYISSDMDIMR